MFCDYAKDSTYFRLYTKNEKEAMLKEVEEEAQIKLERKRSLFIEKRRKYTAKSMGII